MAIFIGPAHMDTVFFMLDPVAAIFPPDEIIFKENWGLLDYCIIVTQYWNSALFSTFLFFGKKRKSLNAFIAQSYKGISANDIFSYVRS